MASRAEILQGIMKELCSRGWRKVYNKDSGILWKKGCLFVFGMNHPIFLEAGCMSRVHHEFSSVYEQGGNSWYVERDGWIVASGEVTRRVGDAVLYGERDAKWQDWVDTIEEIDAVPYKSIDELNMYKQGFMECDVMAERPKGYWSDSRVRDTGFFCVVRAVNGLQYKRVYSLAGLKGDKIVLALLAKDLSRYEPPEVLAQAQMILKLESAGIIKAVEIRMMETPVREKRVVRMMEGSTAPVPEDLKVFGLDGRQMMCLSKAVSSVCNVTPLLNRRLRAAPEFLEALKVSNQDLHRLVEFEVSEGVSKALAPIIRSGYNVAPYLSEKMNAEYVTLLFTDVAAGLDETAKVLHEKGFNRQYVELARITSTYGMNPLEHDGSVLHLALQFYAKQYGVHDITDYLWKKGIISKDRITLRWGNVACKKELFAFFAADGLTLLDGTEWNDYLTKIFERAFYLSFDVKYGIMVSDACGLWGRDYNGIVLLDQTLKPCWRAIKINEKFISYGNFNV